MSPFRQVAHFPGRLTDAHKLVKSVFARCPRIPLSEHFQDGDVRASVCKTPER
jgi:hypothetical protein